MRYFYLILFVVSLLFTACVTEETGVTPLVEDPDTEEEITPEPTDHNFNVASAGFKLENGYVHSSADDETGGTKYHLIFSDTDLAGTYSTENAPGQQFATSFGYFRSINFIDGFTYPGSEFQIVSISYQEAVSGLQATGHFKGALLPARPAPVTLPSESDFQGQNGYSGGNHEHTFSYAYLYPTSTGSNGDEYYRLVLSDEQLTMMEGQIIFVIRGKEALHSGIFGKNYPPTDYLGSSRGILYRSPNFCTNMNFLTRQYDDDEQTEGETLILYDGESFMIRHTGVVIGSNAPVDALYRGSLTILE